MAINIKSIINKKNLTGDEVGKALLYDTAAAYENLLKTRDYSHAPHGIFGEATLKQMINSLNNNHDIDRYNCYVSINNYMNKEQGFGNAYQQMAQLGHYKLLIFLQNALTAEFAIQDSARLPVIVTEKQLADYTAKAQGAEREYTEQWLDVFSHVFKYYYSLLKENPKKKNPLAAAIKACKGKTITNERILSDYSRTWGKGYYIMPDGTRSDQTPAEEWDIIVNKAIWGENWDDNNLIHRMNRRFNNPFINCGMPDNEAELLIIDRIKEGSKIHSDKIPGYIEEIFKWVYYENPAAIPAEKILESLDTYYDQVFEYADQKEPLAQQLTEFEEDFPELDAVLTAETEKILGQLFDIDNFDKPVATWGELADKGILDYASYITDEISSVQLPELIGENIPGKRAWNGVCILRKQDENAYNTDERGYYKEPEISSVLTCGSVGELAGNDEMLEQLENAREESLKGALAELYAFNTVLDIISELTGVDVSIFKLPLSTIESQVAAYNGMIYSLRNAIMQNRPYFSEEEQEQRYNACLNIFQVIDLEELKPTQAAIAKTKAYLADLTAFKKNTPIIIEMLKEKGGEADAE